MSFGAGSSGGQWTLQFIITRVSMRAVNTHSLRLQVPSPIQVFLVATALVCTLGAVPAAAIPPTLTAGTPPPASAVPPVPTSALKAGLNSKVRAARSAAQEVGVQIVDLATGEPVYTYQAERKYIIASNTKLFTTSAALDQLGPSFVHRTPLLARGERRGGRLDGDLAVVGAGDPNISGRQHFGDPLAIFRSWGKALRDSGVRTLDGDLYLIHGFFDDTLVHPDWPRDQLTRWYEAPVHSLSFNDNCVLVQVWPSARPGGPARVEVVPDLGIFEVESTVRTASGRNRGTVHIDRKWGTNVLTVQGTVPRGPWPVEKWVSVHDPMQYFASALLQALGDEGVRVTGKVFAADRLPPGRWNKVAEHQSSLLTTLEVINKRSQNFYAEALIKTLGARRCQQGDWQGGVTAVEEFLGSAGLDLDAVRLADGSGMSRQNRATPKMMTDLLRHMFFHPWGREFVATLPYSGEADLSWRKRLAEPPYRGNVFAKTGTLNGVSTLSGYAKAASGRLYAFSILCNGTRGSWHAKRAQDAILRELIDHG
jgi:D-alanyl-D-alanine carboxypeptidase/D-alanyl-D-alanine-endopeptidase (penicillin-binding protein 4)